MARIVSLPLGKVLEAIPAGNREPIWVDTGPDELGAMAGIFGLHELAVEEAQQAGLISRVGEFESYLFLMACAWQDGAPRKLSFFLGEDFIISVHAADLRMEDWFDTELRHIKRPAGVAYWLLDRAVESFFDPVEKIGEATEEAEEAILASPNKAILEDLFNLRRQLLRIRRTVAAMHTMLHDVMSLETLGGNREMHHYFADVYDHTLRLAEALDANREMLAVVIETYLSAAANRTGDVMRFLTLFATIFMPLTFIVGVYGMNFRYMPELSWRYGYFAVMVLMAAVAGGMVLYFRRRGWL